MKNKFCSGQSRCWYKIFFDLLMFVLVIVYIFSYTRFAFAKEYLYSLKFILSLLVFAWALSMILIEERALRLSKYTKSASLLFLIWIIIMLLSLYRTNYSISGSLLVISYVLMFLLCFVLFPNLPNSKDVYLWFQIVFFWSILIALTVSVLLSESNSGSFYIVGNRVRYQAIFTKPNYLALFSFNGFMASIVAFILSNRKGYLFPIPFYLILIYLSGTRTASFLIVMFLIILLYLSIYSRIGGKLNKMFSHVFLLLFLGFIAIGLIYAINYSSFISVSSLNRLSSNRLIIWAKIVSSMNNYDLIFGHGLGSEHLSALSYDNYYINIFVQTGLFGLLLLLLFISYFIHWFWKKLEYYSSSIIFLVQFSVFITFLLYSFFESILFSLGNIVSIYIWINVGFLINNEKRIIECREGISRISVISRGHKSTQGYGREI